MGCFASRGGVDGVDGSLTEHVCKVEGLCTCTHIHTHTRACTCTYACTHRAAVGQVEAWRIGCDQCALRSFGRWMSPAHHR